MFADTSALSWAPSYWRCVCVKLYGHIMCSERRTLSRFDTSLRHNPMHLCTGNNRLRKEKGGNTSTGMGDALEEWAAVGLLGQGHALGTFTYHTNNRGALLLQKIDQNEAEIIDEYMTKEVSPFLRVVSDISHPPFQSTTLQLIDIFHTLNIRILVEFTRSTANLE